MKSASNFNINSNLLKNSQLLSKLQSAFVEVGAWVVSGSFLLGLL